MPFQYRIRKYCLHMLSRLVRMQTRPERSHKRTINRLLIFDNMENASTLHYWRPIGSSGSILITSRSTDLCHDLIPRTHQVDLQPCTETTGQAFLLNLLSYSLEDPPAADTDAAEQISNALGHLALALHLIGTHAVINVLSYSHLLITHRDFDRNFLFATLPPCWDAQAYRSEHNAQYSHAKLLESRC